MAVDHKLLYVTDREDIFSFGYLLAIIGAAGYNFGRDDHDRDSEDLYVKHPSNNVVYKRLGIQAKCTYQAKASDKGVIPFRLERKNYEDLSTTFEPHILVVVTVPRELTGCTEFGTDHLLLRHRAYWMSLRGYPPIADPKQEKITVHIPISQEFTVESLQDLMTMIAKGIRP